MASHIDDKPGRWLIQVTDTHLFADTDARQGEWRTDAALAAVLDDIHARHAHRCDAVLLSGDLVHDETPAGYQRLAERLARLDVAVYAIPGNHDDPQAMAEAMPGVQVGGAARIGRWRLHLLDSRIPGSDGGRIGAPQLEALEASLSEDDAPTLVAVHHPPCAVGTPWIDDLGMDDAAELRACLSRHPQVAAVVAGHVHQSRDLNVDGLRVLTSPGTGRQFLPGNETPAEDDHADPGYRCLHLGDDGVIATRVHRVPSARTAGRG